MDGFLGTNADFGADLALVANIFLLVPLMLTGFFFARRKMFEPHHKLVMTTIVITNWLLIAFVMAVTYSDLAGADSRDSNFTLATIHAITGLSAQLLGTYLVIRMWFEKQLPDWFKVKKIKRYMRATLTLWLVTAALGITIYFTFYDSDDGAAANVPAPVATEEATEQVTEEVTETVAPPEATEIGDDSEGSDSSTEVEAPEATEDNDDDN